MATVTVDGAAIIDRDLEGAPAKVQRAFVRAAKRAIDSGRSVIVKLIAGDTGLKQKDVRDSISMRYPSLSDPVASMRAKTKRLPLIDFKARQTKTGVTYRNPGGGRSTVPGAFIATTRSQTSADARPDLAGSGGAHVGVFKRRGKARLPIRQLYGPSIGQVFSKFRQQGVDRSLEVFDTNFDHELDFLNSQPTGPTVDIGEGGATIS